MALQKRFRETDVEPGVYCAVFHQFTHQFLASGVGASANLALLGPLYEKSLFHLAETAEYGLKDISNRHR